MTSLYFFTSTHLLPADQQVVVILLVGWLAGSNVIERHFSEIFIDSFKHLDIQIYVDKIEWSGFYVYMT